MHPTNYIRISPRTNPIPPQNQNRGNGYLKTIWRRLGIRTTGQLTSENFEFLEYSRFGNDMNFWRRLGIRTIGQLTSENFEFLEYSRFGNDMNFLEYYGMIKAIKNIKKVST